MGRVRRPPFVPSALVALVLVACGSGEAAAPESASTVGDVGHLPAALAPRDTEMTVPATTEQAPETTQDEPRRSATTTTTPAPVERLEPVGRLVDGNRVLVIGDSILSSISNRHGGQLCDRLVPRGWAVEVNAETGQHVEFGRQVLRRRLRDGLGRRRGHAREQLRRRSGGLWRRARPAARRARPDAGRAGHRDRVQAGPRRGQLRDPGGGQAPRQRPRRRLGVAHARRRTSCSARTACTSARRAARPSPR